MATTLRRFKSAGAYGHSETDIAGQSLRMRQTAAGQMPRFARLSCRSLHITVLSLYESKYPQERLPSFPAKKAARNQPLLGLPRAAYTKPPLPPHKEAPAKHPKKSHRIFCAPSAADKGHDSLRLLPADLLPAMQPIVPVPERQNIPALPDFSVFLLSYTVVPNCLLCS